MRTQSIVKAGLGGGAALLLAGFLAAAPAAQASTRISVPCNSAALIAALNNANSGGGATIHLAPWCTYALTTASNSNRMLGDTGLPVITSRITVTGFHTTISGNRSTFRIFLVTGSGNLTLQGLTITGGHTSSPGGGIFNHGGTLRLNHSTVTGNASSGGMMSAGGGVASGTFATGPTGTTTLNFSRVTGNTASGGAGGILNHSGTLILNHSTVTGNTSSGGGMMSAGGGIFSGTFGTGPAGTATLNFSQVTGNTTSGSGGGILNHSGTLILNFSRVNGNTAAIGGGGIASGPLGSGGIGASRLFVNFSQVNGNTTHGGPMTGAGGIANAGAATIKASVVEGNTAPGCAGGGILNQGTMTITRSKVNNNTAPTDGAGNHGMGGGIANINLGPVAGAVNGGILTISSSQVNHNTAAGSGGGIFEATVTKKGHAPGGPLTVTLSLVNGNTAAQGGGIFAVSGSPVTLKLSLVARNNPDNCSPPGSIAGCKN